jgi:hypothetical protein
MTAKSFTAKTVLALVLLEIATLTIPINVKPAEAVTWLSGWTYRKKLVIAGVTGAGVGYQMMLKVRRGSGNDDGGIVYVSDKCKEDFSDVRFADADGNVFPQWLMGRTTDEAKIWVKVNKDVSVNQTIYIYYGNSDATSYSDFDATFIFGELWTNSTLNTNKWQVLTGTYSIDTLYRRLRITPNAGTAAHIQSKEIVFPSSFVIEGWDAEQSSIPSGYMINYYIVSYTSEAYGYFGIHYQQYPGGSSTAPAFQNYYHASGTNQYNYRRAGVNAFDYSISIPSAGTSETKSWVIKKTPPYMKIYCEGSLVVNKTNSDSPNRVFMYAYVPTSNPLIMSYYGFKIRKFVDPEPYVASWFPEEVYGSLRSSVTVDVYPSWIPNGVFKLDLDTHIVPYSGEVEAGTHNLTVIDEKITINASYIYNFKCWKKDGEVYSYALSCSFTVGLGESAEFTMVYDAFRVNVTASPEINAMFEADGWDLNTPVTIYRGPGYHTFRLLTTTKSYNSTHTLKFLGWYVNEIFLSPQETINIYIAYNTTIKIAYKLEENPQIPPFHFRAQLITLGDVQAGAAKQFTISILFDQQSVTVQKITFQLKPEWFSITTPLPISFDRGLEVLGTGVIEAEVKSPINVQGYYNVPFTVEAKTPQGLTVTTSSYVTFTMTQKGVVSEETISGQAGFFEVVQRLFGNPILLLLLIALIIWLSAYSLQRR